MDDFFTEQLVKRKNGLREHLLEALMILAVAASLAALLYIPLFPGLFIPIIVIVIVCFLFRRMSVEYEYQYVNGSLDVDRILYRTRRKRVFSMDITEMEYLAPADHIGLREYHPARVMDFCSHTGETVAYAMIVSQGNELDEVLFEPNAKILEGFFLMAPRKVIR